MITREEVIQSLSVALADSMSRVPDALTEQLANEALQHIGIKLILPLLDILEFDNRSIFKELMMNAVRDLLAQKEDLPRDKTEAKKSMMVE